MSKLFALLAIVLILSGVLILAVPREDTSGPSSLAPEAIPAPSLVLRAREFAEQVNAPLSILFGLISLVYSRRTYLVNRERAEADKSRQA